MMSMNLKPLFSAIDERPFRPFSVSLTSGEPIEVTHPENIFVLPSRHKVSHIEIFRDGGLEFSMIGPEAIAALHFNGETKKLD